VPLSGVLSELLNRNGIEPVLVDVGASGGSPRIWQPIRQFSTYIGFDGDTREIHHPQEDEFRPAQTPMAAAMGRFGFISRIRPTVPARSGPIR